MRDRHRRVPAKHAYNAYTMCWSKMMCKHVYIRYSNNNNTNIEVRVILYILDRRVTQ